MNETNTTGRQSPFGRTFADPRDEETAAANTIRELGLWQGVGVGEHWPVTTAQAAKMLYVAGDYDILPEGLEDFVARRLVSEPAREEDGGYAWSAPDLLAALMLLEGRRQWLPAPSAHDAKKTAWQLNLEALRVEGNISQPDGAARFDLRQLLVLMTLSDSREAREKLLALTLAVAEEEHGLVI